MNEIKYNIVEKRKLPDNSTLVNPKLDQPKVVTWGTFDCLHDAHKEFLQKASKFGRLYVIIIPSYVSCFNKGYLPDKNELERKSDLLKFGKIENNNIIEHVYIDCYQYGLKSMLLIKPDIIIFGYDQKSIWDKLVIHFFNYYGLYPKTINFPQTDIIIHNGHRKKLKERLQPQYA